MTRARTLADLGSQSLATDAEATAAASAAAAAVPTGAKNLLYNGAMQVAQRGDQTNAGENVYSADRFRCRTYGGSGRYNIDTLVEDVPQGSGLRYSTKWTVATAATDTGTYGYSIEQILEGYDVQRLAYGTSGAKSLTISFWVKVSEAGTYCTGLRQAGVLHSIHKEVTLPANTWTFVEETFDGLTLDLSGISGDTLTNGAGLIVDVIALGAQTSKTSSTVGQWEVGNYFATPNQTDWMATAGNTILLTGVQLEVGDTATEFEHLPFGVELAQCQRYYQTSSNFGTHSLATTQVLVAASSTILNGFRFPVIMRTAPTVTVYSRSNNANKVSAISNGLDNAGIIDVINVGVGQVWGVRNTTSTFSTGAGYEVSYEAVAEL